VQEYSQLIFTSQSNTEGIDGRSPLVLVSCLLPMLVQKVTLSTDPAVDIDKVDTQCYLGDWSRRRSWRRQQTSTTNTRLDVVGRKYDGLLSPKLSHNCGHSVRHTLSTCAVGVQLSTPDFVFSFSTSEEERKLVFMTRWTRWISVCLSLSRQRAQHMQPRFGKCTSKTVSRNQPCPLREGYSACETFWHGDSWSQCWPA